MKPYPKKNEIVALLMKVAQLFFSNKGILKECTLYMGMATIIGGKKEDERLLGKRGLIHQNVMMLLVVFFC